MSKSYKISGEYMQELLEQFIEHSDIVDDKASERIKPVLSKKYAKDLDVAEAFCATADLRSKFISPEFVKNFIEIISHDDFDKSEYSRKTDLLLDFESAFFIEEVKNAMIAKLTVLIQTENGKPINEREEIHKSIIDFCLLVFDKIIPDKKIAGIDANIINEFIATVVQDFDRLSWGHCHLVMPLLYDFKKINVEPFLSNANGKITEFLTIAAPSNIRMFLDTLNDRTHFIETPGHREVFNTRALIEEGRDFFVEFFWDVADKTREEWTDWVRDTNKIDWFVDSFMTNKNKAEISKRNFMADKILEMSAKTGEVSLKKTLFELLSTLELKTDEFNYDNLIDQVGDLIKDANHHKVGLEIINTSQYLKKDKSVILEDILNSLFNDISPNLQNISNMLENVPEIKEKSMDKVFHAKSDKIVEFFINHRNGDFYKLLFGKVSEKIKSELTAKVIGGIKERVVVKEAALTYNSLLLAINETCKTKFYKQNEPVLYDFYKYLFSTPGLRNPEIYKTASEYALTFPKPKAEFQSDVIYQMYSIYLPEYVPAEIKEQLRPMLPLNKRKDLSRKENTITIKEWKSETIFNNPQRADFIDFDLDNKLLSSVKCSIILHGDYLRFGFKLLQKSDPLFSTNTIRTDENSRIFPVLKEPGQTAILSTVYQQKDPIYSDLNMGNYTKGKAIDLSLTIDNKNQAHFSGNGINIAPIPIDNNLRGRLCIVAWGDENLFDITVKNIEIKTM